VCHNNEKEGRDLDAVAHREGGICDDATTTQQCSSRQGATPVKVHLGPLVGFG
jgi:hypothetical protein